MNFVFIYGRPAVGKYTVGKALSERTGYFLFHSHLSQDFVSNLPNAPKYWSPEYQKLLFEVRANSIFDAAKSEKSFIFTDVFRNDAQDNAHLQTFFGIYRDMGGKVFPIELIADEVDFEQRIVDPKRKEMGKSCTLKENRSHKEMYALEDRRTIPGFENLTLNTSELSPQKAAEKIIEYINLGEPDHLTQPKPLQKV